MKEHFAYLNVKCSTNCVHVKHFYVYDKGDAVKLPQLNNTNTKQNGP